MSYNKYVVHKLSTDFTDATTLETLSKDALIASLKPDEVVVHHQYWAINASDVNYTAGRYDASLRPPFDCGFEAIGVVIKAGSAVKSLREGSVVGTISPGAFADYQNLKESMLFPLPDMDPAYIPLFLCGLTAYFAVNKCAHLKKGDVVMVTAAAGGVGQIAVQLAKAKGCTVLGTCSSKEKVAFLKSIGVDRPINYREESIDDVLKREFPKGLNAVLENVGGEVLKTCMKHAAQFARIVIIGAISNYTDAEASKGGAFGSDSVSTGSLVVRSLTVSGFLLTHFFRDMPAALADLIKMQRNGTIKTRVDSADFEGLKDIPKAILYMHQGKNIGKVVVPRVSSKSSL